MKLEQRDCTLCGPKTRKSVKYPANFSPEDLNAEIFSARRAPDKRHFQLMECQDCGLIFSDPACDPSELASLYREGLVNYKQQEQQIYESYAPVLDRALPHVRNSGTFVEIGGGTGFMLQYGVAHGFERQIEIEPSSDAEAKFVPASPNAKFVRDIFPSAALPAGSASLICFFQMLDHVPSPASFLESVYEALEPGGVAVCVTHNTQALTARILGERSPIFDVEHTYLFHPGNLSRLFKKSGFSKVDTFSIPNNYALRHWIHMAPIPGKTKLLPLAERAGLADFRLKLRAGNFAAVARKA